LFPPEALLARLTSPLKVLTGGPRDRPARQQTLHNTIDWSYQLLSSSEQALLARFGVFVGGCTLDAAEAICKVGGDLPFEVADGIASLLEKSLLRQIETASDQPRIMMLETIRAYALERLEPTEEADAIRQRHAAYFCTALHVREADMVSGRPSTAVDEIAAEIDNIRAAWQWAVDHDDIACVQRALESLNSFYVMRGMATEGMSAFSRAIDKLNAGVTSEPTPERTLTIGRLLVRQGWLLWRAIPQARVLARYRHVFGGAALLVPESEVARLPKLSGVASVQPDELLYLNTDRSPQFIGADAIWRALASLTNGRF
jgi:hypothetical protein